MLQREGSQGGRGLSMSVRVEVEKGRGLLGVRTLVELEHRVRAGGWQGEV